MITIQNSGWAFVGVDVGGTTNEFALTNAGSYCFTRPLYVQGWTNAAVDVSWCRDGAVVVVDSVGAVGVIDGPDLAGAGTVGFAVAAATVGSIMAMRYVFRGLWGAAGLPDSRVE